MMFLAENDDFGFGGFVAGIIAIGILMLAVCWIVFPFIVITKFNDLIREVRALRVEVKTKQNEENAGRPRQNPQSRMEEKKPEPSVYKID